ncbi:MBL fold metallo-hydrolase [Thermodesulfobacteriota bacterium]
MRPSFYPRLINDPFSDPGLYIPFQFERRALMFDIGDLASLSARDLLKVTHVFVTHAHLDHFIGFDILLRIFLGRDKQLHIFGPPSFFDHIEGKLSSYNWNLVNEYTNDFSLHVTEIHPGKCLTKTYICREGFKPAGSSTERSRSGAVLEEPAFHVAVELLDHRIPCLGLSLVEHFSINIIKEELNSLGLPVGPWLNRFKQALHENRDMNSDFHVTWEQGGIVIKEKAFVLGDLKEQIARISPGQKIAYITDVVGSEGNYKKIIKLSENADHLFIEAAFLERDKELAKQKYHLTAGEAGVLARKAGAKEFTLFHFSPRYTDCAEDIHREASEAYFGQH